MRWGRGTGAVRRIGAMDSWTVSVCRMWRNHQYVWNVAQSPVCVECGAITSVCVWNVAQSPVSVECGAITSVCGSGITLVHI